jgi:hypothetical protein
MINSINADFDEARTLAPVHTGRTHDVRQRQGMRKTWIGGVHTLTGDLERPITIRTRY